MTKQLTLPIAIHLAGAGLGALAPARTLYLFFFA